MYSYCVWRQSCAVACSIRWPVRVRKLPSGMDRGAIEAVAPAAGTPQQVNVSVKIVEFQARKGVESGLSMFYARRNEIRPYGRVATNGYRERQRGDYDGGPYVSNQMPRAR
jgi:hypothetical protein